MKVGCPSSFTHSPSPIPLRGPSAGTSRGLSVVCDIVARAASWKGEWGSALWVPARGWVWTRLIIQKMLRRGINSCCRADWAREQPDATSARPSACLGGNCQFKASAIAPISAESMSPMPSMLLLAASTRAAPVSAAVAPSVFATSPRVLAAVSMAVASRVPGR